MKKFLLTVGLLLTMLIPQVQADTVKLATLINRNGLKIVVVAGSQTAQQYFGDGFILYTGDEPNLGFTVVTNYKTTLSRSISSTASTIYVSSLTTKDGHSLTMADLGTKVFFTLEPGSNKEEIVMCTGVGTLSWSSCSRGLSFSGTSTSAVTANQKSHSAGSAIVMSNVHYVYDELVDKDTADTIAGDKTFTGTTTFSKLPNTTSSYTPIADGDLATKKFVSDTAIAGGVPATTGIAGISKVSTKAQAASGSTGDGTYKYILDSSMATSTSQVATTSIPITNTSGKLDSSFIDTTGNYDWTGITGLASTTISSWATASTSALTLGYLKNYIEIENTTITTTSATSSTYLQASNDTATTSYSNTYAKLKQFIWPYKTSTITVSYRVDETVSSGGFAYSQLYKNGVAYGTEQSLSAGTVAYYYKEDLAFNRGDLIQIYGYRTADAGVQIDNFRLYFSKTFAPPTHTITSTSY